MVVDEESMGTAKSKNTMGETSPLLATPDLPSPTESDRAVQHRTRVYIVAVILLNCINLGDIVFSPATARIFESVYCRIFYQEHDSIPPRPGGIDEMYCKVSAVQTDVSSLLGLGALFDAMPGLVLAVPMGILADRYGRKWLFTLNLVCLLCKYLWVASICLLSDTVSLKFVWLGSATNLVGGGAMVTESLFFIMLSDITPRDKLANLFFYMTALGNVTRVLGPIVGATLMKWSPWAAIWLSVGLQSLAILAAFALPETLARAVGTTGTPAESPNSTHDNDELLDDSMSNMKADGTIIGEISTALGHLARIFADWRMAALAALYPIRMMFVALLDLLPRYISYRYSWSLANATYLYSLQALGAAICLFIVLPSVSDYLGTHFDFNAVRKSAVLARVSFGILAVGLLLEGIAPSISVLICALITTTFGSGTQATLRALTGSLINQNDNGKVYMGLAIAETIGQMAAFPAVAGLYNYGIGKGGGAWLGLPFVATSLLLGVTTVAMSFLNFDMQSIPA